MARVVRATTLPQRSFCDIMMYVVVYISVHQLRNVNKGVEAAAAIVAVIGVIAIAVAEVTCTIAGVLIIELGLGVKHILFRIIFPFMDITTIKLL